MPVSVRPAPLWRAVALLGHEPHPQRVAQELAEPCRVPRRKLLRGACGQPRARVRRLPLVLYDELHCSLLAGGEIFPAPNTMKGTAMRFSHRRARCRMRFVRAPARVLVQVHRSRGEILRQISGIEGNFLTAPAVKFFPQLRA